MNVVFVVLHYTQTEVTLDCVKSLLNLKGNPQVVLVDNASPDGSGKLLYENYKGNDSVHVILNESNLGFASANNIGYAYAKKELGADVIAVINNDTMIDDREFIEKLMGSKQLYTHHVIAPDIINKIGEHQNPFAYKPLTYEECVKNLKKLKLLQFIYSIPIIGDLKAKVSLTNSKEQKVNNIEQQEMIVPHGAAVIYTPLWVKNEDFAFYPGTFLYLEEEILFHYLIRKQYKTVYLPSLKIHHLEDVSTNARFKNKRKKSLFQIKQLKNSYGVLICLLKNESSK